MHNMKANSLTLSVHWNNIIELLIWIQIEQIKKIHLKNV